MSQILVNGERKLKGKIKISGMKNSALPIIFACLLVDGECILDNIPRVSDVYNALAILRKMGAYAEFIEANTVSINTKNAEPYNIDNDLVSKMRASSYLMGTMLSRFGCVSMAYPGGCNFGSRPIEQHLNGFKALGAICVEENNHISVFSKEKMKNCKFHLDKISVGATINIIMASVFLDGITVIENVAKEPHVDDLIAFLNSCGAKICRYKNIIFVEGVKRLFATRYRIYSDMIEALTYVTCVGVAGGELMLESIEKEHIYFLSRLFSKMGIEIKENIGGLRVIACNLHGANVVTDPYPAFPTDLHPQFASLLCYTDIGGTIKEKIFPGRFAYVSELQKMGASINKNKNTVKITPSKLHGSVLDATDLRAGAALVVAALGAEGDSIINNVRYIVRGYENMVEKLSSVGANIKLI